MAANLFGKTIWRNWGYTPLIYGKYANLTPEIFHSKEIKMVFALHEVKDGPKTPVEFVIGVFSVAVTAGICITKAMNRPLAALGGRPPGLD